jgi:hypothetical protein
VELVTGIVVVAVAIVDVVVPAVVVTTDVVVWVCVRVVDTV